MSEHQWLKWGVLAVAFVGGLALIAIAYNAGGSLEGPTWVVDELVVDGSSTAPMDGSSITATFEDGGVGGISGCNSYSGSYELDGSSIAFGPMATTLMFCDEGLMTQEQAYLVLLDSAEEYEVSGDTLTMLSGSGDTLITYSEGSTDG